MPLHSIGQGKQSRLERIKDSLELFAPTPVGKPEGEKIQREIGPGGGELVSPDNKIKLIIPPDALSKNTTISIQAAANLSLDGVGKAYHLEPSGIQFKKPATLIMRYDSTALNGSSPELLAIVFQDEKGSWFSIGKFEVDKQAKTLTGKIAHFSSWALNWSVHLRPEKTRVKVSKKVLCRVYIQPCSWADPSERGEAVVGVLGTRFEHPRTWSVNGVIGGDADNGTVDETFFLLDVGGDYIAPAIVPTNNPVKVELEIAGIDWFGDGGGNGKIVKTCNVTVYDNYYEVNMVTTMKGGGRESWGGKVTYRDEGRFLISVDHDPTLLEIDNRLEELKYETCKMYLLNPATCTGIIHVTGIKSWKITPANPPQIPYNVIEIAFVPKMAEFTAFTFDCPPPPSARGNSRGIAYPFPMNKMPAMPLMIKFKLTDEEQVIQKIGNPGDDMYVKLTVKKLQQ